MKKLLCLILALMLLPFVSVPTMADAGVPEGYRMTGDDWCYLEKDSGEILLANGFHKAEWVVYVPSQINGKPVTQIGEKFILCDEDSHVVIPKTVRSIGGNAFSGSGFTVYIPSSVTEIADDAFAQSFHFTIYCDEGSTALEYAKAKSIPYLTNARSIKAEESVPDDRNYNEYSLANRAYYHKDYDTAVDYLLQIARAENPHSAYLLGQCFEDGRGLEKNRTAAYEWYLVAAKAGIARAQCDVGRCLVQGNGVKKDPAKGVEWLKLSADQGTPAAYLWLGYCYHKGLGVEKDFDKAEDLYLRAEAAGEKYASIRLEQLHNDRH